MEIVIQMDKRKFIKLYKETSSNSLIGNEVNKEIKMFLETLKEALLIDGKVKFTRIGVFEILTRQARVVGNPKTKEPMKIYPKRTVKFRASKKLK